MDIGRYTRIDFINGIAEIERGVLEPSSQVDAFYERSKAKMICSYKSVFKKLFNIDGFNEEICKLFEKMRYSLDIEEFEDGTNHVDVVNLTNMGIISRSNDLLSLLNEFNLNREENLVNNI